MASKSVIGQLAKQPLKIQLAILGGLLVVLGFVYWQFFYSGLQEARAAEEAKKKTIASKVEELRGQAKELDDLRRELPERKAKIEKGLLKLPARSELPAFLKQLQNQAGAAGVKLKNYAQQGEVLIDDFIKVPYQIEASGTFYQLARYFWLLWEYSKSEAGLIITIENLSIKNAVAGSDGLMLTADFNASTFRQAESDTPAPAAAPAKAGDKPKNAVEDAKQKGAAAKDKKESAADKAAGAEGAADGADDKKEGAR